ncbi:MAG: hypothetical protein KA518_00675 [Acinetobacter sp.]|nr:hypothetical protein [Acinetobacter sp.]
MYGGEKIYNANLMSTHSLKKIAEDNSYPVSKIICSDEKYKITGGIDLDTEEKIINNYKYSIHITICENENCNVDIENKKIKAACTVELTKNYSNQKYSTNITFLNQHNFTK